MRPRLGLPVAAVALMLALVGAGPPQASFNDIEDEVMCVTCNVALNIAESPQAEQERGEIRDLVAQGLTKQQILDRLVAEFGDNVLAAPKAEGINVAAYAVPLAIGVLLLAGLALTLPRWRHRAPAAAFGAGGAPGGAPSLSAADTSRLDEDLARYER
jgi:cytochrome c-type biogenesis protein CcmH/NrfF